MSPEDIEALTMKAARQAALAVSEVHSERVKEVVAESVKATLIQLGVEYGNPLEMQKDFQHLRSWRTAGEELRSKGMLVLVGIFLTGLISLFLVGLKSWFRT